MVGYDRNFAAIIPRSVEEVDANGVQTGKHDVMASVACSRLVVSGITIKHFQESSPPAKRARFAAVCQDHATQCRYKSA